MYFYLIVTGSRVSRVTRLAAQHIVGDCDRDRDCATGLRCFQRSSSSITVPGCNKGGIGDIGTHDYCYKPPTLLAPRQLTAKEIATASCKVMNGHVKFMTSGTPANAFGFYDIPENAGTSAVFVCDITADSAFESVEASYNLIQADPVTKKAQDPDDNQAMKAWGEDATGHNGYFSFGTPGNIVDGGGSRNKVIQANHGKEIQLHFPRGDVNPTTTIRFGFCQSANHEDFSITNLNITIYPTQQYKCTQGRGGKGTAASSSMSASTKASCQSFCRSSNSPSMEFRTVFGRNTCKCFSSAQSIPNPSAVWCTTLGASATPAISGGQNRRNLFAFVPTASNCKTSEFFEKIKLISAECCATDSSNQCKNGVAKTCSFNCARALPPFLKKCGTLMSTLLGATAHGSFTRLASTCGEATRPACNTWQHARPYCSGIALSRGS